MKRFQNPLALALLIAALLGFGLASAYYSKRSSTLPASNGGMKRVTGPPALISATLAAAKTSAAVTNTGSAATNASLTGGVVTNAGTVVTHISNAVPNASLPATHQPAGTIQAASTGPAVPTNAPAAGASANPEAGQAADAEGIQLSFKGANIDMIIDWLSKTTEKSVVKHPRAQCQLTIVNSKKMPKRDAINLVYRALALEGFTTIESSRSIFIVPEGQEPKISPELMDSSQNEIPEGRQRLVKFFPLKHIQPAELKEKVKGVLSEKGTIEVDDRANQVIVTDYTDNIRLLADLIKELDVTSVSDSIIEIYSLKHLEAEEMANLLSQVLNAQSPPPSRSARPSGGGGPPPSMGSAGGSGPPGVGADSALVSGPQTRLWPDKPSNRLLVMAPKSKMAEIQKLISMLDTPKPQDVTLRVIALTNVSAEDLVKEIGPLYQKMRTSSPKDSIEVTANNRSNSLIVFSSEANFKAIERLVETLDTEEAQEKIMQAFPLRNADAEDVAKQLQDLNQEQSSSLSRYYFYYPYSDSRSSKKMNVVADRRRNTVIVQAPPASMEGIAKMIQALDEPVTDDSLTPRIYPLKFVSAVDIEEVLNELFLKKQQQRSYWDYYFDGATETADRNVGRLYGKVRITSEPNSNSLIITANSQEHLSAVEEVLKKLDAPSQAGDTTLRVCLQFARATTVANNINILFAKANSPPLRQVNPQANQNDNRNPQQQPVTSQTGFSIEQESKEDIYYPWLGGQPDENRFSSSSRTSLRPVSELVGRVRVVPDMRSNSLLITCNIHFFPQIMKLVNELDEPTPQVLIEAKIIEVSTDFRDKLGVRWSPDGSRTFSADDLDNSFMVEGSGLFRKVFTGNALADSLKTGVIDSRINLDLLIQFLRKNTDATVLAEPQINIADNEIGKLFVGSQVPFISSSLVTDVGGRNDAFQYKDVGVILEVTPRINNAEEVALKIRAESSNIRNGEILFGGAILDTRNFRTDLLVKSGQTVVLGGIIQHEQQNIVRKVPLLGSIPGLGWAFKKKDKVNREVELMVFLRPRVTRSPEQAQELLREVEQSAPRIKQWREERQSTNAPAPPESFGVRPDGD